MYIVYLLEFINSDEIYIGLTDNMNWQLELEKKFFKIEYNLEISIIKIITFTLSKKDAQIDKNVWVTKTREHNINVKFNDKIPESFISKSLKNKEIIKSEIKKLEDKYIGLYYNYKTMKENSLELNNIIEEAIQESVEKWKDSELNKKNKVNVSKNTELRFDKDGFDVDGYDNCGLDREGYDKDGFDIYLYDRDGFDSDGYDKNGNNREFYETQKKTKSKK